MASLSSLALGSLRTMLRADPKGAALGLAVGRADGLRSRHPPHRRKAGCGGTPKVHCLPSLLPRESCWGAHGGRDLSWSGGQEVALGTWDHKNPKACPLSPMSSRRKASFFRKLWFGLLQKVLARLLLSTEPGKTLGRVS